jgi:hypothetical protein
MKHCPSSDATIKGQLKQTRQSLCSTKPKPTSSNRFAALAKPDAPTTDEPDEDPSHKPTKSPPTNKLHITDFPLAKLYTNNTKRLPTQACSGNQYITIPFHSHCNAILCTPYINRSDKHQLAAYDSIMRCLTNRGHNIDLQILDNKASLWTSGIVVPACPSKRTLLQCCQVRHSNLQVPLPHHHHQSIFCHPPLPLVPAPSPNQAIAQPPLLILHHAKHVSLGTLQWPLQLQCHPSPTTRLPRHHPQQASHLLQLRLLVELMTQWQQ